MKDIRHNRNLEFTMIDSNNRLSDIKDEDLVKSIQVETDTYRGDCEWQCPDCLHTINYASSLLLTGEKYVHSMRCPSIVCGKKCNRKMVLTNDNNMGFDSIYFNELFSRYQKKIISEAKKSNNIDQYDEIYSVLCSFFMKIVCKFARDSKMEQTGAKWFCSYFNASIQNRIADIKRTNNYKKRKPLETCEICRRTIGQLTVKHLLSPGHEIIIQTIKKDLGQSSMIDSGEINLYDGVSQEDLDKRKLIIGEIILKSMDKKQKKVLLQSDCFNVYNSISGNSKYDNRTVSINDFIYDDGKCELAEKLSYEDKDTIMNRISSNISIPYLVNEIVRLAVLNNIEILNDFFHGTTRKEEKIDCVKTAIFDAISFDCENNGLFKVKNKRKFSKTIFKLIRKNEDCLNLLKKELVLI